MGVRLSVGWRWLGAASATVVALAMVVALGWVSPSVASEPSELAYACPEPVPAVPFDDVTDGPHARSIACLSAWRLTRGVSEGRFAPDRDVPRAQMASFLTLLWEAAGGELPTVDEAPFEDVDGVHADNIAMLAELGVTQGTAPGRFSPWESVRRDQLASFLAAVLEEFGIELPQPDSPFEDVTGGAHASNIAALAELGVVRGVGEERFDPSRPVSRAQMASMLMHVVDVLVRAEIAEVPYDDTDVRGEREIRDTPDPSPSEPAPSPPFGPAPAPAPGPDPSVELLEARVGVAERFTIERSFRAPVSEVSSTVTEPLDEVLAVDLDGVFVGEGDTTAIPLDVLYLGEDGDRVEGTITFYDDDGPLGEPLDVRVVAVALSATTIPSELAQPTADQVVALNAYNDVVAGEISITVDLEEPDPDSIVIDVAQRFGAVIAGSVPELRIYQLRFAETLDELEGLLPDIEAVDGIASAGLHPVSDAVDRTIPDDPWPGSRGVAWGEGDRTGDNWGLQAIRAPEAWEETTGSSSVPLAVVDVDFDPGHGDLEGNVTRSGELGPAVGGHGTHVAGTACAEGDNERGITGVAWNCDLRLYGVNPAKVSEEEDDSDRPARVHVSSIAAAAKLRQAAADGARIVNMSMSFVDKGDGCVPASSRNEDMVNWTDALIRQALLWAAQNSRDVLWVFSAGNECRDAATQSPPNLVAQFPTTVMVVGSSSRSDGLAGDSNFGSTVTVSAPGAHILSAEPRSPCWFGVLFCNDRYGTKSGTSMATPHVSGLATLVRAENPSFTASQVRSCIVSGALQEGVPVAGSGPRIDAPAAVRCEGSLDLPAEVDLVLAVDTSGSMGGVINQVRSELLTTLDSLRVEAPSTDFQVAVTSFEDYPGFFDSSVCPNSNYSATYGRAASGDEPFRIELPASSFGDRLQSAVDGLELRNGGDGPESYGRVLWEIGQSDTRAELGLREDALTLVVMFGDNVPHDDDINEGIVDPNRTGDTGIDPGRSGEINCGGDDIDFQDDALTAMVDAETRLLFVNSGTTGLERYWRSWSAVTGGGYTLLGSRPLADVVIELVEAVG